MSYFLRSPLQGRVSTNCPPPFRIMHTYPNENELQIERAFRKLSTESITKVQPNIKEKFMRSNYRALISENNFVIKIHPKVHVVAFVVVSLLGLNIKVPQGEHGQRKRENLHHPLLCAVVME